MQSSLICMHIQPSYCGDICLPVEHIPPLSMIYSITVSIKGCIALQVRLVNLAKKVVLPFKNHRGRVKSIAVIDPGAPRIGSCGCIAALTLILACLSILLSQLAQD